MERHVSAQRTAALLGTLPARGPAYAEIAGGLRQVISDGRIPPGTRLPSERELTVALGVSRTTVTRAYASLKESGHLESRQGSGSLTRLPEPQQVGDLLLQPGRREGGIDLTCAAPVAPPGVAAAYSRAVEELPGHLGDTGYYPTGVPALRRAIAERYAARGLPTDPDQILVTSGALGALAVVLRAFVSAGDRVLVESPTYPNAVAALRASSVRVASADIGQAGWAAASLTDTVRQVRPRAAYLMPDFHNPTGLLMDEDQRAGLARALTAARTLAVVDETMADLAIDERAHDDPLPRPFAVHAPDALSLGSASKTYWGGLRIGWVRAPLAHMPALVAARLTFDLGAPLLEQLALVHLMADHDAILAARRGQLLASRSALVAAMATHLPSWRFQVPEGGLSLWCELPRPLSSAVCDAARRHGVQLAAGPLFAPEGGLERHLRVPFTQSPTTMETAARRLAATWEEVVGERRTSPRRTDEVALAL